MLKKTNYMKYILFILVSLLLFTSCLPPHYVHAPLITSDIENKGDYTISGGVDVSTESKNFNVNSNYAITDHVIVQASATYAKNHSDLKDYNSNGKSIDVAVGYTNISSDKHFYIENFMGYGHGNFNNIHFEDNTRYANFSYDKFFAQLNLNYRTHNYDEDINTFSFHIPIRLAYVNYNKIAFTSLGNFSLGSQIEHLRENPRRLMLSTGKTISYRFDNVKLNLFASYTTPTKATELLTFGYLYVGFGVSWRNFLKKKKRTN